MRGVNVSKTYCVRCRHKTTNTGTPRLEHLKGGRVLLRFNCGECGKRKTTFTSKRKLGI